MNKTFTFTAEQIVKIYEAGIRRGQDEATAYEWGSTASGHQQDEMVEAIQNIVNEGVDWDNPKYVETKVIWSWFK